MLRGTLGNFITIKKKRKEKFLFTSFLCMCGVKGSYLFANKFIYQGSDTMKILG